MVEQDLGGAEVGKQGVDMIDHCDRKQGSKKAASTHRAESLHPDSQTIDKGGEQEEGHAF